MFKIGILPTPNATLDELADFLEYKCLVNTASYFSIQEAVSEFIIPDDEFRENLSTKEDRERERLQESLKQIEYRSMLYGEKYPYKAQLNSIVRKESSSREQACFFTIYDYMLLATRKNMAKDGLVYVRGEKIDGRLLFEQLSLEAAKHYWGTDNTQSFLFGTGDEKAGFQQHLSDLFNQLPFDGKPKKAAYSSNQEKDGKLDVVVWKPFKDCCDGILMGFGQCKTGTNWKDSVHQLKPDIFFSTFATTQPYVYPMRLFFVAESCPLLNEQVARGAGILFDRGRIIENLPYFQGTNKLFHDIYMWVYLSLQQLSAS